LIPALLNIDCQICLRLKCEGNGAALNADLDDRSSPLCRRGSSEAPGEQHFHWKVVSTRWAANRAWQETRK